MLDISEERAWFLDQFDAAADTKYQAGQQMVMKTALHLYGVRVPDLRRLSSEWQRVHKGISRDDLLAMVEALWVGESYEERSMAIGKSCWGRWRQACPTGSSSSRTGC